MKFEDLEDFLQDKGFITINNGETTVIEQIALSPVLQEYFSYYPAETPLEKTFDYLKAEDVERTIPRFTKHFSSKINKVFVQIFKV